MVDVTERIRRRLAGNGGHEPLGDIAKLEIAFLQTPHPKN